MAVTDDYLTFVLDQLRRALPDVRAKRMFGGAGLYTGELIFALVDDDMLYLKVDDETRPDYERRGLGPFQPFGEGTATMQYYPVPEDVLEDPEELRGWSDAAVAVARRAKVRKTAVKGTRSTTARPQDRAKPKGKTSAKAKAAKGKVNAKGRTATGTKAKRTAKTKRGRSRRT